jgi:Tol biopolymer transport system component
MFSQAPWKIATGIVVCIAFLLTSVSPALATFPGEDGVIAFDAPSVNPLTGEVGPGQIWLINADGSDKRQLTNLADGAYRPAWAPDGQRLAFESHGNLWIVNADGSGLYRVTPDDGNFYSAPTFAPDGNTLALLAYSTRKFQEGEENTNITPGVYAIDVNGNGFHLLRANSSNPSWSPDGSEIAFESTEDETGTKIFVMNRDGTNAHQLTSTPRTQVHPDWGPDGRIAFVGNGGSSSSTIYVVNRDGSGQQPIHTGDVHWISWSPSGERVAFSTDPGQLHMVDSDGKGEFVVAANAEIINNPAWQPLPHNDMKAPVLHTPSGITVNATGVNGATVEFVVTAEDDSDPNPQVACLPQSGSTFAIGNTIVSCTATDANENTSASAFEVVVLGAGAQIQNLLAVIGVSGLPAGVRKDLESKLEKALAKLEAGKLIPACNEMDAFLRVVEAKAGKKLTAAQASEFTAAANRIESVLNC